MTKHISYGAVLPPEEISRIIRRYTYPVKGTPKAFYRDNICREDIIRHGLGSSGSWERLKSAMDGKFNRGPELLARLSKFLVMIETGRVVKRKGKVIILPDPEAPPKQIIFKLNLFGRGKVFQLHQPLERL